VVTGARQPPAKRPRAPLAAREPAERTVNAAGIMNRSQVYSGARSAAARHGARAAHSRHVASENAVRFVSAMVRSRRGRAPTRCRLFAEDLDFLGHRRQYRQAVCARDLHHQQHGHSWGRSRRGPRRASLGAPAVSIGSLSCVRRNHSTSARRSRRLLIARRAGRDSPEIGSGIVAIFLEAELRWPRATRR